MEPAPKFERLALLGTFSPTSSPLVFTAVPNGMRGGSHWRTPVGMMGCMIATPAPIATVVRKASCICRSRGAEPAATSKRRTREALLLHGRRDGTRAARTAISPPSVA